MSYRWKNITIWTKKSMFAHRPFFIQKKSAQSYHGPWVPNLIKKFFFFQKEKKKNYNGPECQIWYLVTRRYIQKNKDFFGSPLKYLSLEIVELIEKVKEIKKNIRTLGWGTSRFRVMTLSREVTNFYFLQDQYFVKNFYTILLEWLC